jgi:acetyl-CoA acyltransferase 1
MLAPVLAAICDKVGLGKKHVDDIVVGNVNGNGFAGVAPTKFLAGFPETVAGSTTNRACSSGLSAILTVAGEIRAGTIDVGIGAGVEKLSGTPQGTPAAKQAPKAEAPPKAKVKKAP